MNAPLTFKEMEEAQRAGYKITFDVDYGFMGEMYAENETEEAKKARLKREGR